LGGLQIFMGGLLTCSCFQGLLLLLLQGVHQPADQDPRVVPPQMLSGNHASRGIATAAVVFGVPVTRG
jgi:hypothetical protein